ncbi:MAG TPA: SDR family oxidoreductase [Solimonas sp.]|nr:SDR family oxidoreductase [Solimonas sp.]
MLLKDKVVIVSGIGPGLGVKLAIEAAREGAKGVVVAARSQDKLDDAEARIKALGVKADVVKQVCDITKREQCDALAAVAAKRFGKVDALVNSAFVHGEMDYASTANLDSWRDTLETNLLGTLCLTQATVPHIGRGGAVVMINTMAARKIPPLGEAGYAASKAALANSVKWLAKELGPKGIRVNSVHMGWMWGAPVEGYINWQSQESKIPVDTLKAQIAADIPLGHIPTDDDCAKAALFMVSDYAAAVTGAALDANGGAFMP